MSGRPLKDAIVIEIFAGTARVSACLHHYGLSSAFGVDHVRPKNCCAPISLIDLTSPQGQTLLRKWLDNPRVIGIFKAPPCGTASRARNIKLKRKRGGGPLSFLPSVASLGISTLNSILSSFLFLLCSPSLLLSPLLSTFLSPLVSYFISPPPLPCL